MQRGYSLYDPEGIAEQAGASLGTRCSEVGTSSGLCQLSWLLVRQPESHHAHAAGIASSGDCSPGKTLAVEQCNDANLDNLTVPHHTSIKGLKLKVPQPLDADTGD